MLTFYLLILLGEGPKNMVHGRMASGNFTDASFTEEDWIVTGGDYPSGSVG